MVGARGFEPPTLCSQSRCATNCATLRHLEIFTRDLGIIDESLFGNDFSIEKSCGVLDCLRTM